MADEIVSKLGFSVEDAIRSLEQLDNSLKVNMQAFQSLSSTLSQWNTVGERSVAVMGQVASGATKTTASLQSIGTAARKSVDDLLGVNKQLEKLKAAANLNLAGGNAFGGSGNGGSVDAALGVGKTTSAVKAMQDAARLGLSTYGNALSVVESQAQSANKSLDTLKQRTDSVTLSWQTMFRVMQTQALIRGFNLIRNAVEEAYTSFQAFSKQVGEIQAINPERSFGEIAADLRQLSDAFNQPLSRVAEAQYQVISDQFVEAADRANILTAANMLAKTGADDLAASAQLLTGALNAYGESSDMAGLRAAQFFKTIELGRLRAGELGTALGRVQSIGHELGVSMEALQASLISITIGGVKANEAATQLRGVMTALLKPSEEMSKALKAIGVDSGETAIATFDLQGTLEKLWEQAGKTASGMSKLFPNIRGDAGALRLAAEGAQKYKEGLEALRAADQSTIARPFEMFKSTDAEKLNTELNKLSNFFTAEFGQKIVGQFNSVIQFLGGGNGLVGVLRLVTSELPLVAAGVGAVTLAMSRLGTTTAATSTTVVSGFGRQATASMLTSLTQIDWSLKNNIKSLASFRNALGLIAGIELARGLGQQIGTMIDDWISRPMNESLAALDKLVDVNKQKTAAIIREKQRESDDLMGLVRKQVAANNVEYLKDADNFAAVMKIQEKVTQTAFDRIMQGRQKLTQQLYAASEQAAKNAAGVPDLQASLRQQIRDIQFNQQAERFDAGGQYMMYVQRMREAANEFARLQAMARDDRGQQLADAARQRAEAYLQLAQSAAKLTGSEGVQRQAEQLSVELLNKRNDSLAKYQRTQAQVSRETEARANQSERHNFELEADRLAIEEKFKAWRKDDKGDLVRKSDDQLKKDLAEGDRLLEAFARKWAGFNQQDFIKNFAGDSRAFEALRREAMRQLDGFDIKQLQAAPSAIASMAQGVQAQLDQMKFRVKALVDLEALSGQDISSVGINSVLKSAGKVWKDAIEQISKQDQFTKDAKNALQAYRQAREALPVKAMQAEPLPGLSDIANPNWKSNILDARSAVMAFYTYMDKLSQKTEITSKDMEKLAAVGKVLNDNNAYKESLGAVSGTKLQGQINVMLDALLKLQTAQKGLKDTGTVDPATQRRVEAIRQQLDALQQKKPLEDASKSATEGGASAAQKMANSLSSAASIDYSALTSQLNAAADAMRALASAAYAVPNMQAAASGGLMRLFSTGGNVGTDTIPAMLSPGEMVMNANSTKKWFSQLVAMNAGATPTYRSQGGSVTNAGIVGDVTVNVHGGTKDSGKELVEVLNRKIRRGVARLKT